MEKINIKINMIQRNMRQLKIAHDLTIPYRNMAAIPGEDETS